MLSYLPSGALYFAQRNITGRSKVSIREINFGWEHHRKVAHETGAKSLIEFGAGKTLAQNIYLADVLEQQTVVDLFPMMELEMVNQAIDQLKALGAHVDGRHVASVEDLEEIYRIRYIAPFDMRRTDFADGQFDLCVSTNTLEHIPRQDIVDIFAELARVIRPGGTVSALIDYSDHYSHTDPSISRVNYLQFSQSEWARHNHDNHYQNRMRHGHYGAIFSDAGFERSWEEPLNPTSGDGVAIHPDAISGEETDLATAGLWRLTRRDAA